MYLGNRKIRSAGRTSGSVEITLPARLQILEGVECDLIVRDGPRPEIVLQPSLSAAQELFQELWQKLRLGLGEVDDVGDFATADFTLALFLPSHWQERPPLAYVDALTVLHQRAHLHCEALTRLLAFLAVAAGQRLGIQGALAIAFGDAVAYLITGSPAGLGTDFERGMAHRVFWGNGRAQQPPGFPFDDSVWREARSGLQRVSEQFLRWQRDPQTYASDRDKWYRALTMELGLRMSMVQEYVGT